MGVKVKGHKIYWKWWFLSWTLLISALAMTYISTYLIANPGARFTYRGEVLGGVNGIDKICIAPENANKYYGFTSGRDWWIAVSFTYKDAKGNLRTYHKNDEFTEGGYIHVKEKVLSSSIHPNLLARYGNNIYRYTDWSICFTENGKDINYYHGKPSFVYHYRKNGIYEMPRWEWQAKQLFEHGKVYKIAWYRHIGLVLPLTLVLIIITLIVWIGNCKYFDCWTYCPLAAVCAVRKKKDNYKWREAKWVWMPIIWRIMGYKPADIDAYMNSCWETPGQSPYVTTKGLDEYIKTNATNS